MSTKVQVGTVDGTVSNSDFVSFPKAVKGNVTSNRGVTGKRRQSNVYFKDYFSVTKTKNKRRQNNTD